MAATTGESEGTLIATTDDETTEMIVDEMIDSRIGGGRTGDAMIAATTGGATTDTQIDEETDVMAATAIASASPGSRARRSPLLHPSPQPGKL